MSQDDTQEFAYFGDFDPEDEYDEVDPFSVRLDILERILDSHAGAPRRELRGPAEGRALRLDRADGAGAPRRTTCAWSASDEH